MLKKLWFRHSCLHLYYYYYFLTWTFFASCN